MNAACKWRGAINVYAHLDILPVLVLRVVDVGPELRVADGGADEVVLEVLAEHQATDDQVLHDLRAINLIKFTFICC